MKRFSFLAACFVLALALCSCGPSYKDVKTPAMTEKAKVVQLVYLPDTRSTDIAPGINTDGGITFTVISTGHSEFYGVTIKCEKHNKVFTLVGKPVYEKLADRVGKNVTLQYYEVWREYEENAKPREFLEVHTTGLTVN